MSDCILAIDAGGTVFKYALVGLDGSMLTDTKKMPINSGGSKAEILDSYKKLIKQARKTTHSISGIGIATPGPFDYDTGTSLMKHKLQSLYGISLKTELKEYAEDLPIWFCSDTNAFLAGEYVYGAGKSFKNLIGVTIGTGIGMSIISDGKMYTNKKKAPAEVIFNLPCRKGVLEDYVSGRGIVSYYKSITDNIYDRLTAKDIGMMAKSDSEAKKTFDDIGYILGLALREYIVKYNVEALIIGGQVANSFQWMHAGVERGIGISSCKVLCAEEIDFSALKGILELNSCEYAYC